MENFQKQKILELCAEDVHGCWEFWSKDETERTLEDAGEIFQATTELLSEKLIFALEYSSIQNRSYVPVEIDLSKLENQIIDSIKVENIDPENMYWFCATENGIFEDSVMRSNDS